MFNQHNNQQVTNKAIRLVQSWQRRGIFNTLGVEAQALYRQVESLINANKPKAYSDVEIENMRSRYRAQGYSGPIAMRLTLQRVDERNKQIADWERNLAA